MISFPTPPEPVTTYRVGWGQPAFMVWRMLRLSVTGAAPAVSRRKLWRFAREDGAKYARRALRAVSTDGLIPPWQAEIQVGDCTCDARRGWTRAQAIARVAAEHDTRAGKHRCADLSFRLTERGEVSRG